MEKQRASIARAELVSGQRSTRMPIYSLRLPPEEIVRVVQAEITATGGAPEFYLSANADFVIEEDYDRAAYGVLGGDQYDLVMSQAVLSIEPRVERNYWVLSIIVRKVIGPQIIADENSFIGVPLSLDEFVTRLAAPDVGRVSVRLETQTLLAKAHFDAWWAEIAAQHPRKPAEPAEHAQTIAGARANDLSSAHASDLPAGSEWNYRVREAVAVFSDANDLETAVNDLEISGFDRAGISVLGSDKAIKERIGHLYHSVVEAEDDAEAPRSAFVSQGSRLEAEASAITFPLFIGGLAGVFAVVASGGALAAAIAATILGSATGAGLGALLARTIARRHLRQVQQRLSQGGLLLWVNVPTKDAETRAFSVLGRHGGQDLHVHETLLQWGPKDRPLSEAQVDPLLFERDPPS